MLSMMPYGLECTLGQLGSADPSQFLVHSQPPACQGTLRSTEGLDSVSAAQPEQKHPCIFNTLLNTNTKHSPAPATLKKPTLSQSEPAHLENTALAQAAQTFQSCPPLCQIHTKACVLEICTDTPCGQELSSHNQSIQCLLAPGGHTSPQRVPAPFTCRDKHTHTHKHTHTCRQVSQ